MLEVAQLDLGGAKPFRHRFAAGITVVLGPNNAGKTPLARAIAGLSSTPAGSIRIDGRDVSGAGPRRRPVALVHQAFVNYPNWTVFRNIASPLIAASLGREAISRRVAALAAQLQIDGLLQRLPHELSGGQQQRVALARALAQGGKVLVMDEPLVNLDYNLREEFSAQLRELVRGEALAVVYLTSDPKDAFQLGDEVVLLRSGVKVQAGPPLEVYQKPNSLLAADLMSEPRANRLAHGGAVRPEHLRLSSLADNDMAIEAKIDSTETNGAETFLHCRVQGRDWVARLPGMVRLSDGAKVRLYVSAPDVLWFG